MKLDVKSGAVIGVLISAAVAGCLASMTKEWALSSVAIGIGARMGAGIGAYFARKAS